MAPTEFFGLEVDEYMAIREGYQERLKMDQAVLRFQTALICEALIGGGKGSKMVMDSWLLEGKRKELTADDVKAKLKKFRERQALKSMR